MCGSLWRALRHRSVSINARHLRDLVVGPALRQVNLHSAAAENLVMGTASQESNLRHLRQHDEGPALGLWQMEPVTHDDIWATWLEYRPTIAVNVLLAIDAQNPPQAERLVWDLRYAAIMCRLRYRRVRDPLPHFDDVWALAQYWKDHYNTVHGRGQVHEFVNNYRNV